MEDTRISFETAKLAKQKGVDLKSNYFRQQEEGQPDYDDSCENWNLYDGYYTIVSQSSLQRWLREEHDVDIIPPLRFNPDGYACSIFNNRNTKFFSTYEKCLENELQKRLKLLPNKI